MLLLVLALVLVLVLVLELALVLEILVVPRDTGRFEHRDAALQRESRSNRGWSHAQIYGSVLHEPPPACTDHWILFWVPETAICRGPCVAIL